MRNYLNARYKLQIAFFSECLGRNFFSNIKVKVVRLFRKRYVPKSVPNVNLRKEEKEKGHASVLFDAYISLAQMQLMVSEIHA